LFLDEATMDTFRPSGGGAGSKLRPDFSKPPTNKSPTSPQPERNTTAAPLQPSLGEEMSSSAQGVRSQVSEAADVASSLGGDIKEAAKTATRAVKEQAGEFAADIGHELSKTAEVQKMRGVEAMQGFARAIDSAAAQLEQQSPRIARSVREAAHQVEGLSNNISNRSVDELLKAATDLARRQPMLFIGGAVAAGFALSRFLKSSANGDREQTSSRQAGMSSAGSQGGGTSSPSREGSSLGSSSGQNFSNPRSTTPMGS
jgi:hypothetical protein